MEARKERVAPLQIQPPEGKALPSNSEAKIQKFLIILNRDTGQLIPVEVTTPIEYVPFGFYALSHIGSKKQINRLIRKYRLNPSLLEKYTDR